MTKEIDKARVNPSKRLQPNTTDLIIPKKKGKKKLASCWLLQYEEFKNNHFITTSSLQQQGRWKRTKFKWT